MSEDYDSDNMEARFAATKAKLIRQQNMRYEAVPSDVDPRRARREIILSYLYIAALAAEGKPIPAWGITVAKQYKALFDAGKAPCVLV